MKVSLIQMNSVSDKQANLAQARALIEEAVRDERPDWICLPEVWDFIGGNRRSKMEAAETIPGGPAYTLMQELAKTHRVFIHAGSILEKVDGDERIHNTTVAFDRDGKEVARYRKIHMFDITAPDGTPYNESDSVEAGNEVVAYDLEGFKVGCSICYDMRFAELYIQLQRKGCDIIMVPASFTLQTGKDHWDLLLRARAVETQCYVVAPGQYGPYQDAKGGTRLSYGHSLIADPWGHIVAKCSDGIGFASANIERAQISRVRELIPMTAHRKLKVG